VRREVVKSRVLSYTDLRQTKVVKYVWGGSRRASRQQHVEITIKIDVPKGETVVDAQTMVASTSPSNRRRRREPDGAW
jgi:hypothetical protein